MASPRFDVLGIGNAIVDVLARTEDDFLVSRSMHKGAHGADRRGARRQRSMTPWGRRSRFPAARPPTPSSAWRASAARAAFVGKVKDDELGRAFAHDIRAAGVTFDTPPASGGPSTGALLRAGHARRRAHHEHLPRRRAGPASERHRCRRRSRAAAITYLEGYLWDPPHAKDAFLKAAKIAHGAERSVALTLSDAFCVDRYRDEFLDLIRTGTVDLVFANERELHSLYQTADFDTAVNALRNDAKLAVITRSEKGCLVVTREETDAVPAVPVEQVVDATGAGDLFAAGFLVGLSRGADASRLRAARRARGGRGDPASGRAAGNLAQGAGRAERACAVSSLDDSAPIFSTAIHSIDLPASCVSRGAMTRALVHSNSQESGRSQLLSRNGRLRRLLRRRGEVCSPGGFP